MIAVAEYRRSDAANKKPWKVFADARSLLAGDLLPSANAGSRRFDGGLTF